MLIDYCEMFTGPGRDDALAAHAFLSCPEQDRIEAEFLMARGQGQMVCDLAKKRELEAANNGDGCGPRRGSAVPVGLDLDH